MIRFACTACQKTMSAPEEKAGMRFLCPACKTPLQVPATSAALQAVRSPGAATMSNPAVQRPDADLAKAPLGKRFLAESLAIAGATFRQSLKPITLVFEVQRRRRLRKKAGQAKFALGQRAYESQVGDKKLRGRIQSLGERIQNIQDVKGDARQPTAERKELLNQLAEPFLAAASVPEAVAGEHERARTLATKLRAQEESLQGAMGGLMPPNGLAWKRISIGYTMAVFLAVGSFLVVYQAGASGRRAREFAVQQAASQQAAEEKRRQDDADWGTEKNAEAIVERCGPSVALIQFKLSKIIKGGGTGFMIRPGVVVTNAHVVEDALPEDLKVYFPSAKEIAKTPFACRILHFDRKRDIAILAVEPKVPPLRLADNFKFRSGKNITIIGCPGALGGQQLENAVSTGNLSTETQVNNVPFYQLGAPVNPGNSGGPVFDNRGQVIGVVTLKIVKEGVENISYCIPWKDLKERVEALEKEDPHKSAAVAQSFHGLAVIKEHIYHCSRFYSQMSLGYAANIQLAIQQRRPAQDGINGVRPQMEEQARKLEGFTMDSKKQAFADRLRNDPNLPEDVRSNFGKLLSIHDELKQLFDKPDTNVSAYVNKNRELVTRFHTQNAALAKSLGIEARKAEDDE